MKLYGIKTCDTCRKALKELSNSGCNVEFVDIRSAPPAPEFYDRIFAAFGGSIVNRRSKTWREMAESDQNLPPIDMFTQFPTVMKRPVIEGDGRMTLGWNAEVKTQWAGNS